MVLRCLVTLLTLSSIWSNTCWGSHHALVDPYINDTCLNLMGVLKLQPLYHNKSHENIWLKIGSIHNNTILVHAEEKFECPILSYQTKNYTYAAVPVDTPNNTPKILDNQELLTLQASLTRVLLDKKGKIDIESFLNFARGRFLNFQNVHLLYRRSDTHTKFSLFALYPEYLSYVVSKDDFVSDFVVYYPQTCSKFSAMFSWHHDENSIAFMECVLEPLIRYIDYLIPHTSANTTSKLLTHIEKLILIEKKLDRKRSPFCVPQTHPTIEDHINQKSQCTDIGFLFWGGLYLQLALSAVEFFKHNNLNILLIINFYREFINRNYKFLPGIL